MLALHLLFLEFVLLDVLLLDVLGYLVGPLHIAIQVGVFLVGILREVEQFGLVLPGRRPAVLPHGLEINYHSNFLDGFLLLLLLLL